MQLTKILGTIVLGATLFLALNAQADDKEKIIYNFQRASGGSGPAMGVYLDEAGNLFGLGNSGVFFELSPNGSGGWNYSELSTSNCGYPTGRLVRDHSGNFFAGDFFGDVCEFSPDGSGGWVASIISTINTVSGNGPSSLLVDAAGNLYGVSGANGANGFGYVFELSPTSGGWSLTHLHDFNGTDGNASNSGNSAAGVLGGLTMDGSGNLYGVTFSGGSSPACGSGCGVVFKLTNHSGVWTESVLHHFNGTDGAQPAAALTMDAAGNLYGTTTAGGSGGFGAVFKISFVSGKPVARVVHSFTNAGGDGAYPQSPLVIDAANNIYGTTMAGGGAASCQVELDSGCGMAFKLSPVGNQWKESLLHAFKGRGDGAFPGALVMDGKGNLYDDAFVGGRYIQGLVFEIVP